jgi:ABC-type Fe3+/spermidine/putrescine transport system ATPase subunit
MDRGRIVQVGSPSEIYERPASRFVADFIGLANIFEAEVTGRADGLLCIRCDGLGGEIAAGGDAAPGPVAVMIRPEKMSLCRDGDADGLPGTVRNVVYLGDESVYHVALRTGALVQVSRMNSDRHAAAAIARDDDVRVTWSADSVVVMPR